jgi:ribosomal protein S17E
MESSKSFGQKTNPLMMSLDSKYKYQNYGMNDIDKRKDDEIIRLNNYIQKMNYLIRKCLNKKRVPNFEEGFESLSNRIKNSEDIPNYQETISKWLNDLLKADYINPLITLYEKHIKDLSQEVKHYKDLSEKYANQLKGLLNENKELLSKLHSTEIELKKYMEICLESGEDNIKIMERDYVRKVEERYKLLVKENEILVLNYNKTLKELNQLKNNNEFGQNSNKYQQLNQQYLKLVNDYDSLKTQFENNKQKVIEISKNKNLLENDNLKLKNDLSKVEYELKTYKESNKRYENMLKNDF